MKRCRLPLHSFMLSLAPALPSAAATAQRDIGCARVGDSVLKLDLYPSARAGAPASLIVWVRGGRLESRLEKRESARAAGRPGADVRCSFDGRGATWSEPVKLVPLSSLDVQADSCGYTSLLPLSDNPFLIACSWFKRPAEDGTTRKALLVREVKVPAANAVRRVAP